MFRVDPRGPVDLLSQHLRSRPKVCRREPPPHAPRADSALRSRASTGLLDGATPSDPDPGKDDRR